MICNNRRLLAIPTAGLTPLPTMRRTRPTEHGWLAYYRELLGTWRRKAQGGDVEDSAHDAIANMLEGDVSAIRNPRAYLHQHPSRADQPPPPAAARAAVPLRPGRGRASRPRGSRGQRAHRPAVARADGGVGRAAAALRGRVRLAPPGRPRASRKSRPSSACRTAVWKIPDAHMHARGCARSPNDMKDHPPSARAERRDFTHVPGHASWTP